MLSVSATPVLLKSLATTKDKPIVAPSLQILIHLTAMLFIIDHHISPISQISQGIYAVKVLLYGSVIIDYCIVSIIEIK